MKRLAQATLLLALAYAGLPAQVQAQPNCAPGLIVEDGTIVYGETRATGNLGICVLRPSGVIAFINVPTCNLATPIGAAFRVSGSAAYAGASTIGQVVAPVNCGGTWIDPFLPAFQFGLWYTGLNGVDVAYGTQNRDYLHGNNVTAAGGPDNGADTLCGYDDDDVLVGDADFVAAPALYACMNGGLHLGGGDDCHNGQKHACENNTGYGAPILFACGCGAAPPEIWY